MIQAHDEPRIDVSGDVTKLLQSGRRRSPTHTNRTSSIGHPCARYLTYQRTHWQSFADHDEFLLGIFATGNEIEPIAERILSKAGMNGDPKWRLVGGQSDIDDKFLKSHQISGHIDGILQIWFDERWINWAVADIKTAGDSTFSIQSVDDLTNPDKPLFYSSWRSQLMMYAFGCNLERCALILISKSNIYNIKVIWFDVDYDHVESLLKKADVVNEAVAGFESNGRTPEAEESFFPAKINKPKVCNKCPVAHICNPVIRLEAKALFIDDHAAELLDERADLLPYSKRFNVVNDGLKEVLPEGELIFCGNHVIKAKLIKPKDKKPYWKRTYGTTDDDTIDKRVGG